MIGISMYDYRSERAIITSLCVALLVTYPLLMDLFAFSLGMLTTQLGVVSIVACLLGVIAIFFPSLMGLSQLNTSKWQETESVKQRILLHILVCTPVIYTFFTLVSYIASIQEYRIALWLGLSLMTSFYVLSSNFAQPKSYPAWFRVSHGILALTFILGFLVLHWMNHLVAFWSRSAHAAIQDSLRIWYRASWLEPVLLIICGLLLCSGFYMAMQHIKRGGNRFKRLQTASGSYLGMFFCTHLTAVFYARSVGIDTNWDYATGENGLLFGFQFLIPYYSLALVCFTIHAALAIRQILVAHRQRENRIHWVYQLTKFTGLILTGLVMSAAMGFSINP